MSKKLIIGISIATVLIAAAVLAVVVIRSRSLTEEAPVDGGATTTDGSGTGTGTGLGSSTGGQQPGGQTGGTPTGPQGGPCGDGTCSEGESSWCKPDCGDAQERFLGSIKGTVSGTTITIAWKTDQPSTGDVSYGKTSQYELGALPSSTASASHEVKLTGLSPGTPYHVKVHAVQGDQTYDSGELIFEL